MATASNASAIEPPVRVEPFERARTITLEELRAMLEAAAQDRLADIMLDMENGIPVGRE